MLHDIDVGLNWCSRCGRPMEELFNRQIGTCDGLTGVVHQRYLKAKLAAEAVFSPAIEQPKAD